MNCENSEVARTFYRRLKATMKTKRATRVGLAENEITVRYHDTIVFRFYVDTGDVELDTGGWYSYTTKARLNQCLSACEIPATVYQHTRPKRASDPSWYDASMRRRWFVWFRPKGEDHRVALDGSLAFNLRHVFPVQVAA